MKRIPLFCLLLLLAFGEGAAQNIFLCNAVELSFFSEARFENIEAVSRKGSSAINVASRELAFKVPIQSFIFENGLMQEHFNENYLESDKYPYAIFKGKITEDADLSRDGTYKLTATGDLSIHGVTKTRTVAGLLIVKNGQMVLNTTFMVPVSDHNIDIPKDKLLNISQNIRVTVNAVYEPKQ
ncbi:MAG: YceI family protein [Bacteroidetes bacterium]|nr:YceI family protein [Bacteroidota bacterium]